MNTITELRMRVEQLRKWAADSLAAHDYLTAANYLKMVEVTKVQLLARGEKVVVTSREGSVWTRK